MVKRVSQKERYASWPADFDGSGNNQADRCPQDPTPIGRLHGVTSSPVYQRYYILVGRLAALANDFTIAPKTYKICGFRPPWGLVILHDSLALGSK